MKAGKLIQATLLVSLALIANLSLTQAQVSTNFNATPVSGCAPLVVRFSDLSTGNPTQWRWDLGNGTMSVIQNPSVTYFIPGKYTVRLIASNANGTDTMVKSEFIEVFSNPSVDFSASTTSGCYPLPVRFTDLTNPGSGTSVSSWLWDFGNGNTSTAQNPTQVYTASRAYSVTLQVRNSAGCVSILTKTNMIQTSEGAIARFTNDTPQGCTPPFNINFVNQSVGTGVLSYEWDFGDGSTSTLVSPSHTYTTNGSFTVKLIVTNSAGCKDTLIKANAVSAGSVRADFSEPGQICQGSGVRFSNTSSPTPASVTWQFGDNTSSNQNNPLKTYNTPGTYSVKLVANFGACKDSMTRLVSVLPKPTAAFYTSDTASCQLPFTAAFTNQSVGAQQYWWNFGNNTSSAAENPTVIYNNEGSFSVSLAVTAANGCKDSIRKSGLVKITLPRVAIQGIPDSNCAPLTKTFTARLTTAGTITSYRWSFGDGNTSTDPNPTNTYTSTGVYNVSLIVQTSAGCSSSTIINRAIVISDKPQVDFSANPLVTCANTSISFRDLTPGNNQRWLWDFGDKTTSPQQNPTKMYQDTGSFTIKLKVWNGGCMDSLVKPLYIRINPPIAKFSVRLDCLRPLERIFTNNSIGADQCFWEFGDGDTSTNRNPVHSYATTGVYTIKLRVVNNSSGCEHTTTRQIQVIIAKAQFTASDTNVCKGSVVRFSSGLNASEISRCVWNFGDSSQPVSSTNTNPVNHTYTRSGRYTVSLIVTDKNSCVDTLVKPLYITVTGPKAAFTPSSTGICVNNLITFNDQSLPDSGYPIQQWKWNYGNGITEILTAAPFSHLYRAPGTFYVSLKVTDSKGCSDSIRMSNPINIAKPTALFSTADTISCVGKPIRFTSQSTGNNLQYRWDFGDGNRSTTANPIHQYSAEGIYTIKLVVIDQLGCKDSITKTAYVNINNPRALFTMSDSIGFCPPLMVHFTNQSTNALTYSWDFGDSTYSTQLSPARFYTLPDVYRVRLAVTGKGGCTDTIQKNLTLKGPRGSFTYNATPGCNPVRRNFRATSIGNSSFIWDFNDGNTISTRDSIISHTYTYPGKYRPKLILVDQAGCQVPIRGNDTITVSDMTAKFSVNKQLFCDSGMVQFTDSTKVVNDRIASYRWNFDDGNSSQSANPTHNYNQTGIYYPSLIIASAFGCKDTIRVTTPIKIVKTPKPAITFSGNGCAPLRATFTGSITQPDTSRISWQWEFGNGVTSAEMNPPAQQFSTGSYQVKLSSANSSGCVGTATQLVQAYAIPVVKTNNDFLLCKGSTQRLEATGADNYSWTPAIGLDCTNCSSPTTNVGNNITYTVTGTTIHGCTGKDSVSVTVKEKLRLTYSKSDSVCRGGSHKMTAGGANTYTWTPAAGLDNAQIASPTATPDTSTTYRVVGKDDVGCFSDTGYITVRVNPIPTVEAGPDKYLRVGSSLDLVPKISSDVTEVIWQPTTGVFRNFFPGITVKPTENVEYTVEVKNRGGCRAKDHVTVFVICNGSNIFVPNTFSPNNDGTNDVFFPRGTGVFKIRNLRIFTRWGELIWERSNFDANNPAFGWNGTNKGVQLNSDVFVYTLELMCDNGSVITHRGNIALVR